VTGAGRRRAVALAGQVAVVLGGLVLAGGVAAALGIPSRDALELVGISFGVALVVGLVGRVALRRTHAPLGRQVMAVVLLGVAATLLGSAVAARAMFVSSHDLRALLVILVGAVLVAVLGARRLGADVEQASRSLGDVTRRVGEPDPVPAVVPSRAPAELSRLAAELDVMQERLAVARSREQRLEQSRRELVAWVSHDLRTPLAGIRAMVEALNDGVVDDEADVRRYLLTIQSESDRLAALVDDLFELSCIDGDTLRLNPEPTAIDELVSDTLASARPVAARKGVALNGPVPRPLDGERVLAAVSIPEMSRVLRNLLDNAIRHTPPGGTVDVELCGDRDVVELAVSDECGGIAAHDLDRVFELAYRGDTARSPGGGAGLGLAIAKGLVEAHAGRISVRNEDRGCRFMVRLPRVA
jgi:signal transduction histidine kinase